MKLFISYARVDVARCKEIVQHLSNVHEVWYDRRLHAGQAWWDEIVERLQWCDGFVYLLSPESVASEYCQKEFGIAQTSGKALFPSVIRKAQGGKIIIPDGLGHIHYADLSESLDQINILSDALAIAERRLFEERLRQATNPPAKAPLPVDSKPPGELAPTEAIRQATQAMDVGDFDKAAFMLKAALEKCVEGSSQQRIIKTMLQEAEGELDQQAFKQAAEHEYTPIKALVLSTRATTRKLGCEEFADFATKFPGYDPDGLAKVCVEAKPKPTRSKVLDILPSPFEWCAIPAGKVTLITQKGWTKNYIPEGESRTFDIPAFAIAKYPVTNAQFAKFIEAGGYKTQKWWTKDGWEAREQGWVWNGSQWEATGKAWTEPRYWTDSKWNGAEHPVVGVSWYEAVAFCLWLKEVSGESIMLPTEQQWQRAAQALPDGRDSGYAYPWGNDWDASKCNNNVTGKGLGKTTPVRQYEGVGDSPCKVVDLSGNVWEWCITSYNEGIDYINIKYEYRVLRGGSWGDNNTDNFRAVFRVSNSPYFWSFYRGFRFALSY